MDFMKKRVLSLILGMLGLSACSQYSETTKNSSSNTSASLMRFMNDIDCRIALKAALVTPYRSWENDVFLIGWKRCDAVGYDISKLTSQERVQVIEHGIKILKADADKQEYAKVNRTILANYYYSKEDFSKAVYWAFKGAESGSSSCMVILSNAYMSGDEGLVKDFEEGLKWIYLGAALGNKECKKLINEDFKNLVVGKKSPTLVLNAQKRATEWMKEHSELFAYPDCKDERNF